MNKRPFLVVGLISFLSALLCSYLSWMLTAVCLVLIPLGFVAAAVLCRRTKTPTLWMAAIGTAAVIAMLLARTALTVWPTLAYAGERVTVTARVLEPVTFDQPFLVRAEGGPLPEGTALLLYGDRFAGFPDEGDLVSGEVFLSATFDRTSEDGRYAKARGVYLRAQTAKGVSLHVEDGKATMNVAERAIFGLRRYIRDTLVKYLSKVEAGVCRSITIGDRAALDTDVADDFRASGVYHLLAVSGLHLSVLTGAALGILRAVGVRRRLRAVLTMAGVVLFMALCGFSASVTRAGVMTCLCLSAGLVRRQADGLSSLGLAAFVMLLCDPFCVWDLGWQLSFAATLGLLTVFPVWQREVTARCTSLKYGARAAVWLSDAVGVSLAASFFTLPLTALYFGEVSTVFLLGNLLCVWAGSWLLTVLLAALLTCMVWPSAAGLLFAAASALCRYLFVCTDGLAGWPLSLVTTDHALTAWLFALAAVLVVAYRKGRVRAARRAFLWMAAVLLMILVASSVLSASTVTLSAANTETPVVLVESAEESGLIVSGHRDAWQAAQTLCDRHDVACVDWLLWLPSASNTAPEDGAFTVRVSQLVLAYAVKDASKFPAADETVVLGEGGERIGNSVSIGVRQGAAWLTVGSDTVLICPSNTLVENLPTEWHSPDCLMVCDDLPQDIGCVTSKQVVIFGKYAADDPTANVFAANGWTYTVRTQ
ncbi:MAG: ComEC/Rec2 family competence protein [Clostridia bacterium]|nr:ComEC/Rec2 family competence protein [Clostridia bacterium]